MILFALIALALAAAHVLLITRKHGLLNPDGLFVQFQLLMCLGTFWLVDPTSEVEFRYASIMLIAFASYVVASIVIGITLNEANSKRRERATITLSAPTPGPVSWLAVSILVSVLYFYFVGYNTFLVGLVSFFSDESEPADLATLRLESYAGSRYLFPGYVNQFKNILLPCLAVVVLHWFYANKLPYRHLLALSLGTTTALWIHRFESSI